MLWDRPISERNQSYRLLAKRYGMVQSATMDIVPLKIAALNAAPGFIRRSIMANRFRDEIERTGEIEMSLLAEFLKPDDLALDIGANLGGYSFAMSLICGHVIAFEPNPALARSLSRLHFKGIDVRWCAVGNGNGLATLHLPPGREHVLASLRPEVLDGHAFQTIDVPLAKLDDLTLPKVAFIKIDVEGAEEDVIAGALRLIEADRPTIMIEVEERHNLGGIKRLTDLFAKLDYEGQFYTDKWNPIAEFDEILHQNVTHLAPGKYLTRRAIPYINNFLFLPHRC